MNQNVIKYLRENKDRFSKEILAAELLKFGYPEVEVREGVDAVYGGLAAPKSDPSGNFWDFKSKKIYTSAGQKWGDFVLGVVAPYLFNFVVLPLGMLLDSFSIILRLLPLVAEIFLLVYFFSRRRFIFYGLLASFFLGGLMIIPFFLFSMW